MMVVTVTSSDSTIVIVGSIPYIHTVHTYSTYIHTLEISVPEDLTHTYILYIHTYEISIPEDL